jgi:hypothetical protein
MRRPLVAVGVAALVAFSAGCLPTYGGERDRWEIGCQMRGGTSEVRPGPAGWRTCHGGTAVASCVDIIGSLDGDRWTVQQIDVACRVGDFRPGSLGYI